jgi:hypothetical protein
MVTVTQIHMNVEIYRTKTKANFTEQSFFKKYIKNKEPGIVVHTWILSTREAEVRRIVSSRPAWDT